MEIRNIAIIAHVDHGKTALTDAILKQTGFEEEGVSMDSNMLEKERGITIYSKKASDEIFELFFDLGATEEQLDFTTIYAIAKNGVVMKNLKDKGENIYPLLDTILEKIPPAKNDKEAPLKAQPFNLAYDNFLGRMAIARVYQGTIKDG